ncbi:hypothetical protein [Peribacillus asahii]|uniref:hypothetical protein n=1 Tax=Peribacillus asahii TaxID=228899 RepID=UPI00207993B8|nr:hypothetical protein [Peribacillus asahii]USK68490.1 hypothetical protein LIS76_12815 [Peribacillus asahii]
MLPLLVLCLELQDSLLVGIPIYATVAVNKFATGVSTLSTVFVLVLKKKVQLKQMLPITFFIFTESVIAL